MSWSSESPCLEVVTIDKVISWIWKAARVGSTQADGVQGMKVRNRSAHLQNSFYFSNEAPIRVCVCYPPIYMFRQPTSCGRLGQAFVLFASSHVPNLGFQIGSELLA
jgi:hypothetical protein